MCNAVLWTTVGMSSETGKVTSSDGQLTVTGSPCTHSAQDGTAKETCRRAYSTCCALTAMLM